jgi:hydroxylamine dehydrogenase
VSPKASIGAIFVAANCVVWTCPLLSQPCLDCHKKVTSNFVSDWVLSKHSQGGVDCAACHGEAHTTTADFAAARVPTPDTCAQCHEEKVAQFKKGKDAIAWAAMNAMPAAHAQPVAMMEGMKGCGGCHKLGVRSERQGRR